MIFFLLLRSIAIVMLAAVTFLSIASYSSKAQLIGFDGITNAGAGSRCPTTPLLLDTLSVSSSVAYSTRKLRLAYAGKAIGVQRTSDMANLSIGFICSVIDIASLNTFCAGTTCSCFWFDQSGNGIDSALSTAGPNCVVSGTNQLQNGHLTPLFTATGVNYLFFVANVSQPLSIALLLHLSSTTLAQHFTDANFPSSTRVLIGQTVPTYQIYAGSNALTGGTLDTNTHTVIGTFTGGTGTLFLDGTSIITGAAGTGGVANQTIGSGQNPNTIGGTISEYLLFPSALGGTDQGKIRASWQTYWGAP